MALKKYFKILTLMVLIAVVSESDLLAQKRGSGGNRSPSMSRPAVRPSRPNIQTPSRPNVQRPTRPSGQMPSRPNVQRPSNPNVRLPNQPNARPSKPTVRPPSQPPNRPNVGNSQRPTQDRIRDAIKDRYPSGSPQKPFLPDWYKPGSTLPQSGKPSQLPSRPGSNNNRPPVTNLPERPGNENRPGNRPPVTNLPERPGNENRPGNRPPVTNLPERPDNENRPGNRPPVTNLPERPGNENRPGNRPPATNLPERPRPPIVERPPGFRPPNYRPPVYLPPVYRPPWHPWYRYGFRYSARYWWTVATAIAISEWFRFSEAPVYYIYESGGNVYYEGDKVFVDGVATNPDDYFESVQNQANGVPDFSEQEAEDAKWLPLGVFAISESDVAATTMLIQLAVSDGGVVAGTFFNESTGKTIPIEGLVDEETQRVAFKAADGSNDNLVLETGIYNLTQETAPVLVHFGPEQTQTWTLVRLEDDSVQEPSE